MKLHWPCDYGRPKYIGAAEEFNKSVEDLFMTQSKE